ncbi:SDR family oxidoreductase [Actinoplanes sp. NPDC051851]|uniref:SDR family NAD(P)-dependent oxidoreductase n=1 Tax=Actinoplanes sp. NPDC051851 TaxID=3154753 RepID=UPI00341AD941
MSGRLEGKVALVTGVGSGIGQGIALRFAAEGAFVLGCDIDEDRAKRTAEQGVEVLAPIDLTDPSDVRRFVQAADERYGRADILVNAAAIEPHMAPVDEMDFEEQWRPTIAGEVDLVFLACREAWPLLKAAGNASVINFASVNSFRASRQMAMVAHCAGKGAVLSMTRQLAVEGGPYGIRANTIAPGMVQTSATAAAGALRGPKAEALIARTLVGRLGVPDDIAWCAVYLASDEARWVTGANFSIDGGVTAA